MNWFPVDKHVRNAWRVKSVKRRFGVAGVGQLLELWSFIASEGSQTDEGRGIQRDGRPLDLHGMAEDCDFATVEELRAFLDFLAELGHIDKATWLNEQVVFLPSMNRRLEGYRISKGRPTQPDQVKRGPGRPKKTPENNSSISLINTGVSGANIPAITEKPQADNSKSLEKKASPKTPGNSGKLRGTSGNSGQTKIDHISRSGSDLLSEERSEDQDPEDDPKVPSPAKLVILWNGLRDPGPKVLELTPQRRQRYRAALKAKPNLDDWQKAILYLNGAAWANACGEGTHANFRADLDFLAKPGAVTKCLERLAAKDLPTSKTGAAAGRVAPTPGKFAAALKRRDEGEGGEA